MAAKLSNYWRFFWAGIVQREQTGALVPSQRFLVDKMISPIPKGYSGEIVELGAGTGALTLRLAVRCPKARILACEINPLFARDLRTILNGSGINGQVKVMSEPAGEVLTKISAQKKNKPDFIVSGIPLGNVPKAETITLIDAIRKALSPGGMYIQFQYSLVDRRKIQNSFGGVRTVPVLLNLPPAFVYYARKQDAVPLEGKTPRLSLGMPDRSSAHGCFQ